MNRYVFDGVYREYRGYVFANRKPVTITDRGTLDVIGLDSSFKKVPDEKPEVQAPALLKPFPDPDACPKCGKVVKQGRFMHVKFCGLSK